jgi:hypothetical protein
MKPTTKSLRIVYAIKSLRTVFPGSGLKECKDIIDLLERSPIGTIVYFPYNYNHTVDPKYNESFLEYECGIVILGDHSLTEEEQTQTLDLLEPILMKLVLSGRTELKDHIKQFIDAISLR